MRNLIVVIFMFFGLLVFGQGDNKTDAKGKQGEWKKYHKNGMLSKVGNFNNDKPIGEWLYYFDTGKIKVKLTHRGSESYSISFHKSGGAQSVGKFLNQKKDSTWIYYDLDGFKIASDYYINGEKNRMSYVYYQSGQVAEEKEYRNDFEQGDWNMFWKDGKKKKTANYDKGSLEGKSTYYNSEGIRSITGFFYHDLRDGVWLYFDENGNKIKKKEKYSKGVRVDDNKDENIETEPLQPIDVEDIMYPEIFGAPR